MVAAAGAVAESLERGPRVREIGRWAVENLVPGRVKPMTYKIDTCRFLAWRSELIG